MLLLSIRCIKSPPKEKEKNTILRADRSVLQGLIVAYGAGREFI
jgi:hypothetical protein